jgi:hypothetical protein
MRLLTTQRSDFRLRLRLRLASRLVPRLFTVMRQDQTGLANVSKCSQGETLGAHGPHRGQHVREVLEHITSMRPTFCMYCMYGAAQGIYGVHLFHYYGNGVVSAESVGIRIQKSRRIQGKAPKDIPHYRCRQAMGEVRTVPSCRLRCSRWRYQVASPQAPSMLGRSGQQSPRRNVLPPLRRHSSCKRAHLTTGFALGCLAPRRTFRTMCHR